MPVRTERGASIRRLAPVALVPAAAIAVHQLRYWLAFGAHAGSTLQQQGHSYLHSVTPWIVLLLAVAVGSFLRALGHALGGACSLPRYSLSFGALWMTCSACLLAIYVSQEFLEGLFAAGHPAGLVGVFGYGGWWSIPASVAVGLVLATSFLGARWVLHEVAQLRARPPAQRARRAPVVRGPLDVPAPRVAPLAGGWSGRGPPS